MHYGKPPVYMPPPPPDPVRRVLFSLIWACLMTLTYIVILHFTSVEYALAFLIFDVYFVRGMFGKE